MKYYGNNFSLSLSLSFSDKQNSLFHSLPFSLAACLSLSVLSKVNPEARYCLAITLARNYPPRPQILPDYPILS